MITSNQPLYITLYIILHRPFEKRSKNVLSYWYYITLMKHQECAHSCTEANREKTHSPCLQKYPLLPTSRTQNLLFTPFYS